MDRTYWHKQTGSPLYPDLLWSRPENRTAAGKLLIVGGNAHGFAAAAEAYATAASAGIGVTHVLLPDVLRKIVGKLIETADFAPSTPSGTFNAASLAELLAHAHWADAVLLAGDVGRNSETAIVLEKFADKYPGQLTITKDCVDYFTANPITIVNRPDTMLVLSLAQLQKFASNLRHPMAITFGMDLLHLVDWLYEFTKRYPVQIITRHLDNTFVAVGGQVSTTKTDQSLEDSWRVGTAATACVWWLQNPTKTFEALTTSFT